METILRKSLMITQLGLHHSSHIKSNFWSCHLTGDRKLAEDFRHVRDIIDVDFPRGGISTLFSKMDSINK